MKVRDYIKNLNADKFFILDTTQDGLSAKIIHGEGDVNYTRYCYNTHKYSKLEEGSIFLYRQTKRSSKNRKFYFFGGGYINEIKQMNPDGDVQAMVSNGFSLLSPVYEDDPRLDQMTWTSKNKVKGRWDYFWNQYGMNQITKDEFLSIVGDLECVKVNTDEGKVAINEIVEENSIVEKPSKKPEDFEGTYTKSGSTEHKTKKAGTRKTSPRKIDYDSLNKNKKTRGTFGEILVFNDEVDRLADLGVKKDVEHVALTKGDGLGYDIQSYDDKGNELFIEVKTTTVNKVDGFYLTPKELEVCKDNKENYRLYRVYNLNMNDGTYNVEVYTGEELLSMFDFEPVSFIAKRK